MKLYVHDGPTYESPQVLEFDKPFHCQSFPCNLFMRPTLTIKDMNGAKIGRVHDPFVCGNAICCVLDQHIYDDQDRMKYMVKGTTCQLGMCWRWVLLGCRAWVLRRGHVRRHARAPRVGARGVPHERGPPPC